MSRVHATAAILAAATLGLLVAVPVTTGAIPAQYHRAPECGPAVRVEAAQAKTSASSADDLAGDSARAERSARDAALGRCRPVRFVANVGQAADEALFVARGGGMTAVFTKDALWFQLADVKPDAEGAPTVVRAARVALRLLDASSDTEVRGETPTDMPVAFFGGRATGESAAFANVRYAGVRPGVDLVLRGDGGAIHYDVHVAPEARLDDVRLRIDGATGLRIDADGALVATTAAGDFRQGAPAAFEIDADGERRPLASRFVLTGGMTFGFAADGRDPSKALLVDPVLSYASYLGGSGSDVAYGVATAGFSEAYVVGATMSTDFPLTPGAIDPSAAGQDAFVVRVNFNGSALLGATYFGGSGADAAHDVAVGADGTIYVCGDTASSDFPTTSGAFDVSYGGGGDGFVLRLAPGFNGLYFSTFLGGSGVDALRGIELSPSGAVVVAGSSDGAFPTTLGVFQAAPAGGADAVFAALTSAGNAVVLGGRCGGSGADRANALALDPTTGDLLLAGETGSANWPTTAGAWIVAPPGPSGTTDGFAAQVSFDGATLLWSTFVGGAADDAAYGIATDGFGATFVGGRTFSTNFPTTSGAFDTVFDGASDGFVAVLDLFGGGMASTFVGGGADDGVTDVAADLSGGPQLAGFSDSADFPVTFDGFQPTPAGGKDGFFAKVDAFASTVDYATFLGGAGDDVAQALVTDPKGGTFVVGGVQSDFPATSGAFDQTAGGAGDAFIYATVFCYAKPSVSDLGGGCSAGPVPPALDSTNALLAQFFTMSVTDAAPGAQLDLWFSLAPLAPLIFGPCTLHLDINSLIFGGSYFVDPLGEASATFHVTPDSFCCGLELIFQAVVYDPAGLALSNGVRITIGA